MMGVKKVLVNEESSDSDSSEEEASVELKSVKKTVPKEESDEESSSDSDSSEEEASVELKSVKKTVPKEESDEESSSESESEDETDTSEPKVVTDRKKKLDNLTPEERKKEKNKLKRKRQAEKKKAKKIKRSGDEYPDELETEEGSEKKKKFYDPDNEHNKKSAAQIQRFKVKHKNPNKKLSKATPEKIIQYKKEFKAKMKAKDLAA